MTNLQCLCSVFVYFIFPVFKAHQLFLLEINVLYNLHLNMGMFTYHVIKISSKILPLSYLFVDVCLQNWRPLFADIVFTHDTFHSDLRKTDRFFHQHQVHYNRTKKGQDLYKTLRVITHQRVFVTQNYFTHDYLRLCPIVLVTNSIIRLNAVNYCTNTFITDILLDRKYTSYTIIKKQQYYF